MKKSGIRIVMCDINWALVWQCDMCRTKFGCQLVPALSMSVVNYVRDTGSTPAALAVPPSPLWQLVAHWLSLKRACDNNEAPEVVTTWDNTRLPSTGGHTNLVSNYIVNNLVYMHIYILYSWVVSSMSGHPHRVGVIICIIHYSGNVVSLRHLSRPWVRC